MAAIIRERDRVLITAHANPDGDAVGSMSAAGYLLRALGKQFALYNVSGLPRHLAWLELPGPLYAGLGDLPFTPELILALDCGDVWRAGKELGAVFAGFPSLNIDHHMGNAGFASLGNLVRPDMAATGEVLAAVADAAGVPLRGGLAEGVYLALIADTGSFSFGNTTAEVLELTARMMRLGLDVERLRAAYDSQWTKPMARLWGCLMQSVTLRDEGRIAVCEVRRRDFAKTGAAGSDLEGFVEHLRCYAGVRVALLVREEQHPGTVRISLRSRGGDDVRRVAAHFGGGGHRNAAGAVIAMPGKQAVALLVDMIRADLDATDENGISQADPL
jgi:phosphoesterase RecJ-like protein